jgi:hypothetical protein
VDEQRKTWADQVSAAALQAQQEVAETGVGTVRQIIVNHPVPQAVETPTSAGTSQAMGQ